MVLKVPCAFLSHRGKLMGDVWWWWWGGGVKVFLWLHAFAFIADRLPNPLPPTHPPPFQNQMLYGSKFSIR